MEEYRWKQRFENFSRALSLLEEALAIDSPDVVQRAGLIQFFEMSFELAWNTIKDYLELQGFTDVKSPRSAIKKAFQLGLIQNGHDWIQLLEDRNLTSHAYDETTASAIEALIRQKYATLFRSLYSILKTK